MAALFPFFGSLSTKTSGSGVQIPGQLPSQEISSSLKGASRHWHLPGQEPPYVQWCSDRWSGGFLASSWLSWDFFVGFPRFIWMIVDVTNWNTGQGVLTSCECLQAFLFSKWALKLLFNAASSWLFQGVGNQIYRLAGVLGQAIRKRWVKRMGAFPTLSCNLSISLQKAWLLPDSSP